MGTFFIYILKSSVCVSLFYLFFRVLLSKETFHRFNRIVLLGVLFLSLMIPLVEVTTSHQADVQQAVLTVEQLLMMAEINAGGNVDAGNAGLEAASITWGHVVILVYLAGIVFLVCRSVYSLLCLFRLVRSGMREKLEKGIVMVVHDREIAPFSWMKYVVISRKDMEENGREILIHESAHIRQYHSVDLLLADVCVFFQWFNPGAWLLKQELRNIHEYEADVSVINDGVNAKDYQLLLIKKAVGTRLYSMANSFNHSKLKKRITMMLKEKSNPWARLKCLYVLPLAAIAITAFARPEISTKVEEISAVKVNDLTEIVQEKILHDTTKVRQSDKKETELVFEVVEQMPEYPGGVDALRKYLAERVTGVDLKGEEGGRIIVGFTVTETGKVTDVKVIDSELSELDDEAKRIVREMPDWTPGKQRGKAVPVKYTVPVRFGSFKHAVENEPMVLIDGKEVSVEDMKKLNADRIETITVLKDSASKAVYGKRGAYGVILVKTKKPARTTYGEVLAISSTEGNTEVKTVLDYSVSGTVVDEKGRPKAGVSVILPNTTHGTITDANGNFSIKTLKDNELYFSFIGYKSVMRAVSPSMFVKMEQDIVSLLPETSGTLKRKKSDSKVGLVNNITIRGIETDEPPLVIIDGKVSSDKDALSKISPDRIKSLSVLKDKAAIKIYGDKAKNGVIVVELLTDEEKMALDNKTTIN